MITESERKELTVLVAEDFKRHQYDEPKDRARAFFTKSLKFALLFLVTKEVINTKEKFNNFIKYHIFI